MPTTTSDWQFLAGCGALFVGGLGLIAVGYYLMPLRVARHWWHNRF